MEWNTAPFNVTVEINLVNDNMLTLLLNGTGEQVNYTTQFYEGQNYTGFGGTIPVRVSDGLSIVDDDVGPNVLTRVEVSLSGGTNICTGYTELDGVCMPHINTIT